MKIFRRLILSALMVILTACAHHQKIPFEAIHTVYAAAGAADSQIRQYAPLFLTHDYQVPYNRIGRPAAKYDDQGHELIYVDSQDPVIYFAKRDFTTLKGTYTNLIYRVHFPEVPFSLIPFNLTAGNNIGLMVVVTLDLQQRPVLVTSVHTCGCYLAIVPTSFLPRDALPVKWSAKPLSVYGETLPGLVDYSKTSGPKLLAYLRPQVHRIMDLKIIDREELQDDRRFSIIEAPLKPLQELENIPLGDGFTSFYYQEGILKGHVKGSIKPLESIFMSLPSLDFFVGTDKVYADSRESGNPFYTSIKPWNRNASEMWDFAKFLAFWGWRL